MSGAPPTRQFGKTGLQVTAVCVGGSPIGSVPELFGEEVERERALETVRRVFDGPFNFLDTANSYGNGESERRIGAVIAERGGLPDGFVLATKVDPDPASGDYSGERVRRSAEESLARLGLDRLQLLYLHDPERLTFEKAMAPGGPVSALAALRDEGIAAHIGVAGGPVDLLSRFVRTAVFEALITHNRYTLVDRSAQDLIAEAAGAGLGVANAAVFGGGLLAKGPDWTDLYAYGPASPEVLGRVRAMQAACAAHSVSLRAAALQFSLRNPQISTTIVGTATPAHLDDLAQLAARTVPEALWDELAALTVPESGWLR